MSKLSLIYILFVCYAPATYLVLPNIYGDISVVWVLFFIGVIWYYPKVVLEARLPVANLWIACIAALTLLYVLSVLWTSGYGYDLYTNQRLFARRLVPLLVAIMALSVFLEERNSHNFMKHLIFVSCALSIYAIVQKVTGISLAKEDRAASTFQNPNALAIFLMTTVPMVLYLMRSKHVRTTVALTALAIIAVGVALTGSRKGMFSVVLAASLFYFLHKDFKKLVIAFVMAMLAGVVILYTSEDISSRLNLDDLDERTHVASTAIDLYLQKPVIGWGYNGFRDQFSRLFTYSQKNTFTAHNTYATILANYGTIGFIAFMGIFVVPLVRARRILKTRIYEVSDYQKNAAIITISVTLPFMIAIFFTGGNFQMYYMNMIAFSVMAFTVAQYGLVFSPSNRKHTEAFQPRVMA